MVRRIVATTLDRATRLSRIRGRRRSRYRYWSRLGLVDIGPLVELEGQCRRRGEHVDSLGDDLDLAGREVRVGGALGPEPDRAGYADAVLGPESVEDLGELGLFLGVADHLGAARGVAQVHEHHTAVVAPASHPSR